jgi:hypothetical protein
MFWSLDIKQQLIKQNGYLNVLAVDKLKWIYEYLKLLKLLIKVQSERCAFTSSRIPNNMGDNATLFSFFSSDLSSTE